MSIFRNKYFLSLVIIFSFFFIYSHNSKAENENTKKQEKILIKNVNIFNGTSPKLITGKDLVITGNEISAIIPSSESSEEYSQVIDGNGGYLTPGLIDIHWHSVLALDPEVVINSPKQYIDSVATWESEKLLMRGVTTIRDAGGDTAGLKRAIDEGYVKGPRIYPSQAVLSQYSGHTDFRNPNFLPKEWGGPVTGIEQIGLGILANGRQQVLAATRNNLYLGATQIKVAVSGGVISYTDPLYVHEYTLEELEAAVQAAEDYGTYVMAHVHSAEPMKRAIKAGIKSLDHCSQADEEAIKMMSEKGVYLSVQPLTAKQIMETLPKGDVRQVKAAEAWKNTGNVMEWAKKYNLKMGWGTDLLNSLEIRDTQLQDLTIRKEWFSSPEIMIQATGNGGEIVALSGKRNPYGKVGVIEQGAMADMLIYSKNPLEDIAIVEDFENNLEFIMKDGKIYKDTLNQ
ncbi:MAG: amidohydrolase family protein [Thermodesulfobacteriota bacterium]